MKIKEKPGRILFLIINTILLLLITFACLAPIWHMVMASLSNPTALNTYTGLILFPLRNIDVQAYRIILQYDKLWSSYLNTILYIISTCVLTAVLTTIAGYIFSRKSFFFRNTFMMIISFTMLFNGGMIPNYIVIRGLHMTDTPWALIVPGALSVFNIIIMRTSMENVPMELSEAAKIDGDKRPANFVECDPSPVQSYLCRYHAFYCRCEVERLFLRAALSAHQKRPLSAADGSSGNFNYGNLGHFLQCGKFGGKLEHL